MIIYGYTRSEIPADKAATVERLDAMRQDGWTALESMGVTELDALEAEVNAASVQTLEATHPHNQSVKDARQAIKHRRSAIRRAALSQHYNQQHWRQAVDTAQTLIMKAIEQLERASDIPSDAAAGAVKIPLPMPPISAADMTDAELAAAVKDYRAALEHRLPAASNIIGLLKTPEAKAIAKMLKQKEIELAALHESARANLDAATAELSRRNARAALATEYQADLPGIVADLQERVADLEAGK